MRSIFFNLIIGLLISQPTFAAQKAKVASPEVEIYSGADFDSEIIDVAKKGQTYMISDKPIGAFYKIKTKSGKIGYIPDYEVEIPGKGRTPPKDFEDVMMGDLVDETKKEKQSKAQKKIEEEEDQEEEFEKNYHGLTLQVINFHENTLGGVQVDDLTAIGYKSISDLSWEVIVAFKTPKYYTEKLNASVNGFNLWTDFGISNRVELTPRTLLRYGGAFFAHASQMKVKTATKNYDMQDISVGVIIEGGYLFKVYGSAVDLSLKYFFDRNSYGGLGVSLLF